MFYLFIYYANKHKVMYVFVFVFRTRKVRGTLNFDEVDVGLVSDSLVANSLYLQNGKPPSASATAQQQLKTE